MDIRIEHHGELPVAILADHDLQIQHVDDAVDLLGNADYLGASHILIQKSNLDPAFFELRTGIAGEILQKFSNYRKKLAIIGNFTDISSKSLSDFIRESNRSGSILFVNSKEEALEKFTE